MAIPNFTPHHNLLAYSDEITNTSAWASGSIAASFNDASLSVSAPPARYNVTKVFQFSARAGQQNITFGSNWYPNVIFGEVYYLTCYAKYVDHQYIAFGIIGAATYICHFDIVNGTVGSFTAGGIITDPEIEDAGNGWYKLKMRVVGNTSIATSHRVYWRYVSGLTLADTYSPTGGELVYISSPQVQHFIDADDEEYEKYIPTVNQYPVWGEARPVLNTSLLADIRSGVWSHNAEDVYSESSMGGYLEKIKKYVCNKITKSSGTYTIFKDDESTTYETGTTSPSERNPD